MTVGELIKEFVDSKKHLLKSVSDYESMFGVSYHTLHKYFNNKRLPGYSFIYGLKKAGMNISVLFNREVYIETMEDWENNKNER